MDGSALLPKEERQAYISIRMDKKDNVTMVLQNTPKGVELQILSPDMTPVGAVVTVDEVPFGHKSSIAPIKKGEYVWKFGAIIGRATREILPGEHTHIQNVISIEGAEKITGRTEANYDVLGV